MEVEIPLFGKSTITGPLPRFDKTEKAMVGYSIKNRSFKPYMFERFARLFREYLSHAVIVIFDEPYAYNDAAQRGDKVPTADDFGKARKAGDERAVMIQRIFRRVNVEGIRIIRWPEIRSNDIVVALVQELRLAVDEYPILRERLLDQAFEKLKGVGFLGAEYFINFQLEEIPVLVYLYYVEGYLMDIYPGENFQIFSELEAGIWSQVLPRMSSCVDSAKLTFVNIAAEQKESPR
jgi:hypothetical protein